MFAFLNRASIVPLIFENSTPVFAFLNLHLIAEIGTCFENFIYKTCISKIDSRYEHTRYDGVRLCIGYMLTANPANAKTTR